MLALIFGTACLIVGGTTPLALALVSVLALLFAYLAMKDGRILVSLPKHALILIGIFFLACVLSIFHSYDIHQSIIVSLWLVLALILGFEMLPLIREENGLLRFSRAIIALGFFASLAGFCLYFLFDDYGDLQMIGTFFSHNAFAGFLLLPLSFAISALFASSARRRLLSNGIAMTVILSAFMLSLSRGGWTAFALAWIFILIFAFAKKELRIHKKQIAYGILTILTALVLAFAVHSAKMSLGPAAGAAIPSSEAIAGDNALSSRVQYVKYGFDIARDNPLSGVGFGAYSAAEPAYRASPIFQTVDPHNLYVRIFAETGIVGGLSFLSLVICLAWLIIRTLSRKNIYEMPFAELGLLAGVIAMLLHNFMDVDWHFPAVMLVSIISFFVLYAVFGEDKKEMRKSNIIRSIFLAILVGVSIVSMYLFLGNNSGMDGPYLESKGKTDEAQAAFDKGLSFDRWNPDVLSSYANFLSDQAGNAKDPAQKQNFLLESRAIIDRALAITPKSSDLYDLRASDDKGLDDAVSADADLNKAISSNPSLDLAAYLMLSRNYLDEKRYDEALAVADRGLAYYPPGAFDNPFWSSPEKPQLRQYAVFLMINKSQALLDLGRKDEAKQTLEDLKQYSN